MVVFGKPLENRGGGTFPEEEPPRSSSLSDCPHPLTEVQELSANRHGGRERRVDRRSPDCDPNALSLEPGERREELGCGQRCPPRPPSNRVQSQIVVEDPHDVAGMPCGFLVESPMQFGPPIGDAPRCSTGT